VVAASAADVSIRTRRRRVGGPHPGRRGVPGTRRRGGRRERKPLRRGVSKQPHPEVRVPV